MSLLLGFGTPLAAQDINIDFSLTSVDVPPASFGAAGLPGVWNGVAALAGGAPVPLVDVTGAATAATVTNPLFGAGLSALDDPSLPVDVNTMFRDGYTAGDLPATLTVSGLRAADYDLLLYGYVPSLTGWETWFLQPGGQQIVSSFWLGKFAVGLTHVRVRQAFPAGTVQVRWANPTGIGAGDFGWFSGMQIARVWKSLGGGTVGVNGKPKLSMSGTLKPGTSVSLSLIDGAPSALSVVFMNVNSTPAPFLGGVLHAFPVTAQVIAFTDGSGALNGSTTFAGAPSGTAFTFQVGVADPSVPIYGASLSDAVVGTAF